MNVFIEFIYVSYVKFLELFKYKTNYVEFESDALMICIDEIYEILIQKKKKKKKRQTNKSIIT